MSVDTPLWMDRSEDEKPGRRSRLFQVRDGGKPKRERVQRERDTEGVMVENTASSSQVRLRSGEDVTLFNLEGARCGRKRRESGRRSTGV